MSIEFECPGCRTQIRVPDDAQGKKGLCPQCKGKIRVPELSAEQMAASTPAMAIEFRCPRCSAVIRTPAESAGTKGYCPTCRGKVRVPIGESAAPPPQSASNEMAYFGFSISPEDQAAAPPQQFAPAYQQPPAGGYQNPGYYPPTQGGYAPAGPYQPGMPYPPGGMAPQPMAAPPPRPFVRKQPQTPILAIILPVSALILLIAVAVYLMVVPRAAPGYTTAVVMADSLSPKHIDHSLTDPYADKMKSMLACLTDRPLVFKSERLSMHINSSKADIEVQLKSGDEGAFYRVNVPPDLDKFYTANSTKLEAARYAEMEEAFPRFMAALRKRCQTTSPDKELFEFRNSVGLNTLTGGLGYHMVAIVNNEGYPCVMESADSLYFALPKNLDSFTMMGKPTKGGGPTPGKFIVRVTGKIEAPKPEEDEGPKPLRRPSKGNPEAEPEADPLGKMFK